MYSYVGYKKLTICILIILFLLSPFSILIIEANEFEIYYLQSSKVLNEEGEWVTGGGGFSCNNGLYNCYAYAINRFEGRFYNLSYDDQYQPGEIYINTPSLPENNTLVEVRDNLLLDLETLGYTDIQVYYDVDDIPSTIDYSTHELICFRVGSVKYHFMRYDNETQSWYHKPSTTAILKYTANNGIPSNDVPWTSERVNESGNAVEPDITYTGNIWYVVYNKLQLTIPESGELEQNIDIKGGLYKNTGKDAFYEIVVPESGYYTIELDTPSVEIAESNVNANFNYEIYSYNMYNGNYTVLSGSGQSGSTFTETINLTAYDDYNDNTENWKYQTYKHYIRLDFSRANADDQVVNVSITPHTHDYTYDGEKISSFMHKAYCRCGEYITEGHTVVDGVCSLCGATHTHRYSYSWNSYTMHQKRCLCGYATTEPHVVSSNPIYDSDGYTTCLLCGGKVSNYLDNCSINQLPHTENGSYVTPSGIIVLVDEDIEAYLNGELIFLEPEGEAEIS